MKQQPFANTLRNALAGIRHVWRVERNFQACEVRGVGCVTQMASA